MLCAKHNTGRWDGAYCALPGSVQPSNRRASAELTEKRWFLHDGEASALGSLTSRWAASGCVEMWPPHTNSTVPERERRLRVMVAPGMIVDG
jgi:hypothetical protein